MNNLRQIGVVLLNHEATYRSFPPSSTSALPSGWDAGTTASNHGWCSQILPFLEEQALYDRIDFRLSALTPVNESAASYVVPTYRCPSYRGATFSQHATYLRPNSPVRTPYAIGNYIGMGATDINALFSPGKQIETQGILRPKKRSHSISPNTTREARPPSTAPPVSICEGGIMASPTGRCISCTMR